MTKKILLGVLAFFVILQFLPPKKNNSNERTHDITTKYVVPQQVSSILNVACNDCHSNNSLYPWYTNVQPVGWWMWNHVEGGKKKLNFSTFTSRRVAIQNHKFEEIIEMVEDKEMPLGSYTLFGLHAEADLSDAQRKTLTDWAQRAMDTLAAHYPADSLVLRRRK